MAYQPVRSFNLSGVYLVGAGQQFSVTITGAQPEDISGKFRWDGVLSTERTRNYTAPSKPGSMTVTVTAPGGCTVTKTVVVADTVSQPYSDNSRALVPGAFVNLLVDVDGVTVRNDPSTYGEITLSKSASDYLELTADHRVRVMAPGRTAFSVKGVDGSIVNIIVVATEPAGVLALPTELKEIGEEAFADIAAEAVAIAPGCESIGSRAFAGSMVKLVTVPSSVTMIADDAFPLTVTILTDSENSAAVQWAQKHGVHWVKK